MSKFERGLLMLLFAYFFLCWLGATLIKEGPLL